jgi:hypothetical protein
MGATAVAGASAKSKAAKKEAYAQGTYNRQLSIWRNEQFQRAVDYQYQLAGWQEENYYKNAVSAEKSAQGQYAAVLEQVDQVRDKTIQKIAGASRRAQAASSFIRASASETGTTGSSIRLVQQRAEHAEARFAHAGFTNLKARIKQGERHLDSIHANIQNIINRAMPGPMAPVDPVMPTQQVQAPSSTPYFIQGLSGAIGAAAWSAEMNVAQGRTMWDYG